MLQHKNSSVSPLLKTLIYSSLFHYPLTREELFRYCITSEPIPPTKFSEYIKKDVAFIKQSHSFFFLKGEHDIVLIRRLENKHYDKKIAIAKRGAKILSYLPSILFIGISGSLAAGSASAEDDIDFFIITKPNTAWATRLFSLFLLSVVNLRRKRGVDKAPNKICLNIFLEDSHLSYFTASQELYTAHELAQLYPLLNRRATYERLLDKNRWYLSYLPHAHPKKSPVMSLSPFPYIGWILQLLNPICFTLQMTYMKKHKTKEIVTKEILLLHPYDYKGYILDKYHRKLMEYDSLTKV